MNAADLRDLINGLFECAAGVAVLNHCRVLYRDKIASGVSIASVAFFTAWGLWNIYYYPSLDQVLSFAGGLFVVAANATWGAMLLYYRTPPEFTLEPHDEATCICCGCSDSSACAGGCWWLRVDYDEGFGICSNCEHLVDDWDNGTLI